LIAGSKGRRGEFSTTGTELVLAVSQNGLGQGKPSAAVSEQLIAAEAEMFQKITQQDPAFMKDLVAGD